MDCILVERYISQISIETNYFVTNYFVTNYFVTNHLSSSYEGHIGVLWNRGTCPKLTKEQENMRKIKQGTREN